MGHAAELVARLGLAVCWGLASGRGVEITLDALTGGMYLVNRPIAVAAALMIVAAISRLTAAVAHERAPNAAGTLGALTVTTALAATAIYGTRNCRPHRLS